MIPALAALPMVEGLVGGVVGTVANVFAPSQPTAPAPATSAPFASALSRVTSAIPSATSPGIMRADQWNQMSGADVQSWAQSLTGHHIDATDTAGHAITGTVNGVTPNGNDISLNINGHPVALSDLKQISWSATAA